MNYQWQQVWTTWAAAAPKWRASWLRQEASIRKPSLREKNGPGRLAIIVSHALNSLDQCAKKNPRCIAPTSSRSRSLDSYGAARLNPYISMFCSAKNHGFLPFYGIGFPYFSWMTHCISYLPILPDFLHRSSSCWQIVSKRHHQTHRRTAYMASHRAYPAAIPSQMVRESQCRLGPTNQPTTRCPADNEMRVLAVYLPTSCLQILLTYPDSILVQSPYSYLQVIDG